MNVNHLRAAVEVARSGSFTRAAETLGLTQAAVSQHVAALERRLGAPLFDRIKRKVVPSAAGIAFLDRAQRALAELENGTVAVESLLRGEGGTLRVASLQSVAGRLLPRVALSFRRSHPQVDLRIREGEDDDVARWLADGTADIGFVEGTDGALEADVTPLFTEDFQLAVHPGHPLARRRRVSLREIAAEPFAYSGDAHCSTIQTRAFSVIGINPPVAVRSSNLTTTGGFVRAGVAVALVPRLCIPLLGNVVGIDVSEPLLTRTIGIATPRNRFRTPSVIAFIEIVKRTIPEFVERTALAV
ncbi:MAG TPA: LysR family transcriptional regulator [Candidatus Dormibacteraeota bacterium]|nr:LysR family transcriptional regulator [Candidatus Dormibacteraeota bacterium]